MPVAEVDELVATVRRDRPRNTYDSIARQRIGFDLFLWRDWVIGSARHTDLRLQELRAVAKCRVE
jgi:hypothetical protein